MNHAADNIYTVAFDETWELFSDFLDGPREACVLVVATDRLDDIARQALASSFSALGWGENACLFATWPEDLDDPTALLTMVEGLDPLMLAATDRKAARMLDLACRQSTPFLKASRLMCRPFCAFESFGRMLETAEGKQRAWAALKTLPSRT